jgi:glycosyltransferase involved in cell wall biosynthesis
MIKIDYLTFLGHESNSPGGGTCNHPHYQLIINYMHPNIEFQTVGMDSEINDKYQQYIDDMVSTCINLGYNPEIIHSRIPQIHPNCKYYKAKGHCAFAPTLCYYGSEKHMFNVEDWFGIYGQLDMEFMRTLGKIDRNSNTHIFVLCHMLQDCFLGVTTHMQDSIKSFKYLFSEYKELEKKFIYFPLALPTFKEPRNFDKIRFLFTNSYGAHVGNFYYRNGHHVVSAYIEFCQKYPDTELLVLGTCPPINHPNISVIGRYIENNEFESYFDGINVMIIPSRHIHAGIMSKCMSYGIIPIVSDAWKFEEFVTDDYTGFVARGQDGYTSFRNEEDLEVLMGGGDTSSPSFRDNLISIYEKIYNNRSILPKMSANCIAYAKENFSIEKRNNLLWEAVKGLE